MPIYEGVSRTYYSHMKFLAVVGACYTIHKGIHLLGECYKLIELSIASRFLMPNLLNRYGKWAVVTGATDGIGKAYAEELASRGMNIILISRNREKLQTVSEAIAAKYGVQTSFIEADFSKGREVFPAIRDGLKHVDVGILVNNAGVLYEYPERVTEVPEDKVWEIINVNIAAATMMVHIVLPGMVQRKKGAIVNVASVTAFLLCPQIAVYSASKAFLDSLSRCLHHEYASEGIFIQSLTPFFVETNMIAMSNHLLKQSVFVPIPKDYARQAVRTIGVCRRTTGYWSHHIQLYLATSLPEWALVPVTTWIFNTVRKEYFSSR
ncbi:inactive hydroxysteroid dehydrogenase-like protein 1 [Spea bombifrons]|uniref:inactive hydroxysteroid dehydrogenase-like protein 1 n=1 Tax=Spea bombifrons TaxID=233779 RepID=UPI00234B17BD|nr:inactive hydroxysteroid dehydrogenase-like protein 1 [Spea bombifrons]